MEDFPTLGLEDFWVALTSMYRAETAHWIRAVSQVKLTGPDYSYPHFLEYADDFRFHMEVAGTTQRFVPSPKEKVKLFIKGLRPVELKNELFHCGGEDLDEVISYAEHYLLKVVPLLPPRIVTKVKTFVDERFVKKKDFASTVPSWREKEGEKTMATTKSRDVNKTSAIRCFKCLQLGHYATACPNPRHAESTHRPKKEFGSVRRMQEKFPHDDDVEEVMMVK